MNKKIAVFFTIINLLWLPTSSLAEIKTVGPQSSHDASHDYFISLLKLALAESGHSDTLKIIDHQGEARALQLLRDTDLYDILWTGQSIERDKMLLKIPVPLFLGGLGIRGSIIKKDFLNAFNQTKHIVQLKKYIACQGHHWPDANKLEAVGINVIHVINFDSMMKMVSLGRCDFLPLSIFEGEGELLKVKEMYPNLTFSTKVLFHYDQKMYFYVKSSNPELAQQVQSGLKAMIDSGRFLQFMQNHPLTKSAFPLSKYAESTKFPLDDSELTLF
ncbi:hypothetical protein Q4575_03770 [Psychrosphaera sp. 1_MG-2023]|uniref:hypothetical protein n=1 Tax=Psychrosphaera sp. 1_MG-2023 TaxID=3062643 RepID=UPI0026E4498D|nr:hypothetical protein [Psychrosphaera sp. 1_MG-2023]MBU2881189.1 hypothetical protein [Psychrosphaera sp. I2R16]MDO6718503.1 hypothetical protein [Psychrosphaera sp. 1_MG-2023]